MYKYFCLECVCACICTVTGIYGTRFTLEFESWLKLGMSLVNIMKVWGKCKGAHFNENADTFPSLQNGRHGIE